ncbi:heavy metal translocating P-type ATPase [bacterium]|nr:heavy metal translocating P-type ATPase [bacterium]
MNQAAFRILGMDCAEEIAALKAELSPMDGVGELSFDLLSAKMTVEFDPASTNLEALAAAVKRTGMTAKPWTEKGADEETAFWERRGRSVMTTASGAATAAGFVIHAAIGGFPAAFGWGETDGPMPIAPVILYSLAIITGGWFVFPKAAASARRLRPDMNLLMTVAVIGAVVLGDWFEAATVAFLFALSLLLESWSVGRARRAIGTLMALAPPKARIICPHDGDEEMVDVDRVAVGTTVIVRPGEKFPLDGQILKGDTTVNEAPITGESVPVEKAIGANVYAGTINGSGAIEFESTKEAEETTLSRIIHMVRDAQSKRSPTEQWVDKFARVYTPAVMAMAALIAVVPPLLLGEPWDEWFYQALVLLVIACPCALVISTPVSIVAALASAARQGVLVKGGLYLELPSRLKALALDKTGTLTIGKSQVRKVVPLNGHTEEELIEIAASLEARSEHPLAQAIVQHAREKGLQFEAAEDYQALKGRGARARRNGREFWIGSHRLLSESVHETPELRAQFEELASVGNSVVVLGNEEHVCGLIALADAVRPEAHETIHALHHAGIRKVVMLTGDNEPTARAIAAESGIDDVRAELLPEDKLTAIEELVAEHGAVAMVGDGVNDAPAMARASLGIAMGAVGTDVALETADIALMKDDLSRLPWLVKHSRRTLGIIHQNIVFSLVVKGAFVVATLLGIATLWAAIAADMGVSLLVVMNALRLLGERPDSAEGGADIMVGEACGCCGDDEKCSA